MLPVIPGETKFNFSNNSRENIGGRSLEEAGCGLGLQVRNKVSVCAGRCRWGAESNWRFRGWKEIQGLQGSGWLWETACLERSFSLPPACHFSSLCDYSPSSHPFSSYSPPWEKAAEAQGVLWCTGDEHLYIFLLPTSSHMPTSSRRWPRAGQAQGMNRLPACSGRGKAGRQAALETACGPQRRPHTQPGCCTCDGESPAERGRKEGGRAGTAGHIRTAEEQPHLGDAGFCSLY